MIAPDGARYGDQPCWSCERAADLIRRFQAARVLLDDLQAASGRLRAFVLDAAVNSSCRRIWTMVYSSVILALAWARDLGCPNAAATDLMVQRDVDVT
jgi:hypothetical protein